MAPPPPSFSSKSDVRHRHAGGLRGSRVRRPARQPVDEADARPGRPRQADVDRSQDRKDRYGRLLRYVKRKGRDVGKRQVRRGWAKPYVYERPFERLSSYRKAKRKAKRGDRGVWRMCGGNFHKRGT